MLLLAIAEVIELELLGLNGHRVLLLCFHLRRPLRLQKLVKALGLRLEDVRGPVLVRNRKLLIKVAILSLVKEVKTLTGLLVAG